MSTHPFQTFRLLWLTLWRRIPRRLPPDFGPTMQRLYYPMLFIGVCFYILVLMLRMTQAQKIDPTQPATAFALPTGRTPLITPSPASNPQSPQPTTAIVPPSPTPSVPVTDSPSPDSSSTDSASTPTPETQGVDSSETTEQSNPTQSESFPTATDSAPETETSETGKTEAENPETPIPAEDSAAQTTKTNPSETAETQSSENPQPPEAPATPEPAESLDNRQIVETNAQNPATVPEITNAPPSPQADSPEEITAVGSSNLDLAAILPMIAQVKAMPSDWVDSNLFAQPQFFFQGTDATEETIPEATALQRPDIIQLQWISLQHPDQVLETLSSSVTSDQIELEAQGNYGGGGVYALKQGTEILAYVNLVPTKMGVGTLLVIWKQNPRLMAKPAFT